MKNANNQTIIINAQPGAGANWLTLTNNASDGQGQNLGITQTIDTQAGATYTLSLAYAGGLGLTTANSQIGIYLDDQLIAKHANTSSNSAQLAEPQLPRQWRHRAPVSQPFTTEAILPQFTLAS